MSLEEIGSQERKVLLKAIIEGKIRKEDIKNGKEIAKLLTSEIGLLAVFMGEIASYSFDGREIDKEEHERLSALSKAIGIEEKNIIANFTRRPNDIPLSNSENEISLD